MWHVASFIFESLASGLSGSFITDNVSSGKSEAQESSGTSPPTRLRARQLARRDAALLHSFNARWNDSDMMATHVVPSHVHPTDGLAIRLNIKNDNTTLHLHTNGTHAMTLFDQDDELTKRDFLETGRNYFSFSGVDGLKAQGFVVNAPKDAQYAKDARTFAQQFAVSNMMISPIMQAHDSWAIQVCNTQRTATFWYGKIVAELDRPGTNYEPMDPPGCG